MGLSYKEPGQPVLVPYMDLGGGLNTRLDPHALQRNELTVSQNLWSSYDQAIMKRPGSDFLVTPNGATGSGVAALALSSCRDQYGNTILILCNQKFQVLTAPVYYPGEQSYTWTTIGSVSASTTFITTAQMFDPVSGHNAVFLCDGHSNPQVWYPDVPGSTLHTVDTSTGHLPQNYNGTGYITPQFVKTLANNSHLFYAGEPTNQDAVYVSDPFYPTQFSNNASQVTNDPTVTYYPAVIGNNDGVDGGAISGLETIGSVMVVFKQSSIYTMVQTTLLGEVPAWQVVEVSRTTGCQAPLTITRFPTFIIFLSIDGVYLTDGNTTQKVSGDVPTFFDSSMTGDPAMITLRGAALGVRHGNRYLLFYTLAALTTPQGTLIPNNAGMWFDFDKQSRFGNPICGEIRDMQVMGAVSLRGNNDDGNVAWADAILDRVGIFGIAHSDFGKPIKSVFVGKADFFEDVFGPEEITAKKQLQDAYLLVEIPPATKVENLDFYGTVIVDLGLSLGRTIIQAISTNIAGQWGDIWGQFLWTSSTLSHFNVVKIPMQGNARGYLHQIGIAENSDVGWIIIGYGVYVNPGKTGY